MQQPRRFFRLGVQFCLYDYANQGSAAFIDDACKRLLQLCLCIDGICRSFVITPSLAISYSDLPKMFDSQIRLVSPSKPCRRKLMICSDAFSPPSAGLTSVSMFAMIIWMDGADALSRTP